MSKGLPRSLQRGNTQRQPITTLRVPLNDVALTVAAAGSAVGFGTAVIGGLPQGNLLFLGAVAYVKLETTSTNVITQWLGDFGVGVAPTVDADLGDVEEDALIPATTIDAVEATRASVSTRGVSTATEQGAIIDNTDGSKELNLNALIDATSITDGASVAFVANGVVHLSFIVLGDD